MKLGVSTFLILSMFMSSIAVAAPQESVVAQAATVLTDVAESVSHVQLPAGEVKAALFALAEDHYGVSTDEFEERWKANSPDAWEVDSSSWGSATIEDARAYVEGVYKDRFDENGDDDESVLKTNLKKIDQAFSLLSKNPAIEYGVAPLGAIQCGIRFAELVIVDTETGESYEVVMEGSGC